MNRGFFNLIRHIYKKPIANVILSGETLKAFPSRSGTRPGCLFLMLLFNTVMETPMREI